MSTLSHPSLPPPNQKLLNAAWQRQRAYDQNASRYQRRFVTLRTWLAFLSVLVVILSVLERADLGDLAQRIIDASLLVLPVTITALLGFSVRFDRGQNWILLRGNAESLKMEIYYYRAGVGDYQQNRDAVLSKRIKYLSQGLKGSPIHQAAMAPHEEETILHWRLGILVRLVTVIARGISRLGHDLWQLLLRFEAQPPEAQSQDDVYTDLTNPDDYLQYRLEPQFDWYRQKAKKLAWQLQLFQAGVYLFGGVGTLLAASNHYKSWVAVTTTMVGAFTNYLEFKRVEISLVGYNQAADTLYDIRAWWYSLSETEQGEANSFGKLVTSCEETIHSENSSWLQDMQDRLAQLYGISEDEAQAEQVDRS
jgi:hypothetical protein